MTSFAARKHQCFLKMVAIEGLMSFMKLCIISLGSTAEVKDIHLESMHAATSLKRLSSIADFYLHCVAYICDVNFLCLSNS